MMLGAIQSQMLIGKRIKHWSPADLFANGEQGSFWGPLPYYSDAAGTVEADWGDPVGFIPDASGNGNDWTQVTSTARPILGRVPVGGRRNLVVRSNIQSLVGSGEVLVTPGIDDPYGGTEAYRCVGNSGLYRLNFNPDGGLAAFPDQQMTLTFWVRWVSGSSSIRLNGRVNVYSFPIDTSGEWTKYSVNTPDLASTFQQIRLRQDQVLDIAFAQLELGTEPTPYQRVGNEYDITEAGVKGIHYLRFDGTDDDFPNTLPAIQGTIVLAGTNGIWIDSLDFAGGTFSVGPDTYTGGPAGLMSILGDLLVEGCFVIDRALTPEEIAQVKGYYVARGSAGLIELGPELVTNGTFDTDLSGWVLATSGTSTGWVWDSGAASTNSSPEDKFVTMHQSGVLTTNDTYLVSADVQITSGTLRAYLGITASPPDVVWPNGGSKRNIATALNADSRFALNIPNGAVVSVDNVSCRRLIMPGETP